MTKPSSRARWLRRGETALWVVGLSLLGWALATTLVTRIYQARQERAWFPGATEATSDPAPTAAPAPKADPTPPAAGDPLVLGRIEIPRIGVTAIVREGTDDTTLALAVGHISGTTRPGEGGNMALAGHRDSFFRPLQGIRPQDTIRVVTPTGSYQYAVDSIDVVAPEDTWVLDPTPGTTLTLVTCYPFTYVGHAPNRFIVRASLVGQPPLANAGGESRRATPELGRAELTRPAPASSERDRVASNSTPLVRDQTRPAARQKEPL